MHKKELQKEFQDVRLKLKAVGIIAVLMLSVGAIFYHQVEKLNWIDAFYFCTITLATVGYGDIVPHTDLGKVFTIFYVIAGVGIIATFANLLIKQAAVRRELKRIKYQK